MFRCSPGDVRRQVPVRLVQEDLHALRHLLLQQPRLRPVQVLRLNTTSKETVTTTQQEQIQPPNVLRDMFTNININGT